MKTLHISVADKVATYQKRDGDIVCGNSDYQIQFTFDREWDAYPEKVARFKWLGQYYDMDINSEGICSVPKLRNTTIVEVGVYAGDLSTTTAAIIPAKISILCNNAVPSVDNDRDYANEAKEAADRTEELLQEYIDDVDILLGDGTGEGGGSGGGGLTLVATGDFEYEEASYRFYSSLNYVLDNPIYFVILKISSTTLGISEYRYTGTICRDGTSPSWIANIKSGIQGDTFVQFELLHSTKHGGLNNILRLEAHSHPSSTDIVTTLAPYLEASFELYKIG